MRIYQLSSILIGGVRAYGVGTSKNAQGGENKGFQGLMDSRSISADSSAVRMQGKVKTCYNEMIQ
jgi:hypothetical protein